MGLAAWYASAGRHDLPWRTTRDRWAVLVSEVMLQQTQVSRVETIWPDFMRRFPTPAAMAAAPPGAVIEAWGRLGYPRRARRLWEAAQQINEHGWPSDLTSLPGVGRYTADAVAALSDGAPNVAVDVNVRRVVERCVGDRLSPANAAGKARRLASPLPGRDATLALMDLGALVCHRRSPECGGCPLRPRCATRGPLPGESLPSRQARYEGSFRQARGQALALLRVGPVATGALDAAVLDSLVTDGLAVTSRGRARLP